ncbi:MAG: tRNA (N(6)-L-threonylcarbamoyladenosine(37)-C(2))-methylthiotransferase MtaB [Raoultibacter sp.]
MRYAIVNLGCKVNRVESDSLALAFESLGMKPLVAGVQGSAQGETDNAAADLVVINTCTVTGEAEKKTRKAVRRALKDHSHAIVIVTGCAAAIDAEVFEQMDNRVVVVGKLELSQAAQTRAGLLRVAPSLAFAAGEDGIEGAEGTDSADGAGGTEGTGGEGTEEDKASLLRVGGDFPTRVGIKVQDGCNNACTYCIVHVARGRAWSRPYAEVLDELIRYTQAGVHEIVLTGINLGSYKDGDMDLTALLERMLEETEGVRFRISSIESRDVDDRLIALMARSEGRIARHLHLPLQSGSARVLREMARPYTAEQFSDLVEKLYAAMPQLSLSTDIIVGFPGETEEDFAATLAMAKRCRFSKIHVFPYSIRTGTPAAKRSDQIDPRIKAQRAQQLSELGEALRKQEYEKRRGSIEEVLVESNGKGMTESYFEIAVSDDLAPGALVNMRLP